MRLNSQQIAEILPQAYPFIMIDRVVEFKKGESLTAIKNITGTEWIFEGQARQSGVFPETLLIEAAAQATIVFCRLSKEGEGASDMKVLLGRVRAEFFNPVRVGDQVTLKTLSGKMLGTSGYMDVGVSVSAERIADIQIMYSIAGDHETYQK